MESKITINEYGDKIWTLPDGKYHREDGPAMEFNYGYKIWFLEGIEYTEQEHKYEMRTIKLERLLNEK